MATKVTLRQKQISKGRKSLYLDFRCSDGFLISGIDFDQIRNQKRMKKYTLLIIYLNLLFAFGTFARPVVVSVDSIFNNITQIRDVKVLFYTGDTLMTLLDLGNGDTIELECKWKTYWEKYNGDTFLVDINFADTSGFGNRVREGARTHYENFEWEGSYPKVGELVTMINYQRNGNRILFARKLDGNYRFWNPWFTIFSANVYVFDQDGIYKPLEHCENELDQGGGEFHCVHGFLISEIDFDQIRKQ